MNPVTDMERILDKYKIQIPEFVIHPRAAVSGAVRQLVDRVKVEQAKCRAYDWARNRSYVENVTKYATVMTVPALKSKNAEVWMVRWLHAAQEERVMELCAVPHFRHRCLRGCPQDETAYHVAASCVTYEYFERHDFSVYWILRALLEATGAPQEVWRKLGYGSGVLHASYEIGGDDENGTITIDAGGKILTDSEIYHNRPDIVVRTSKPKKVVLIEVAVTHLQNLSIQEKEKRCRYSINSEGPVTPANVGDVGRGRNLVGEVSRMHGCEVALGVMVFGCFGEVVRTPEFQASMVAEGIGRRREEDAEMS